MARPALYGKKDRSKFATLLKKLGLTGAQKALAEKGQNVSLTTLRSVAMEHGITFQRGRPTASAKKDKGKAKKEVA
jgi:hypothetical protein